MNAKIELEGRDSTNRRSETDEQNNSRDFKNNEYERIHIGIVCRILSYLNDGKKRILNLQMHCGINAKTCEKHTRFLTDMDWIKDMKEGRARWLEITEEGREYQEKFCKKYGYTEKNDYFDSCL